MGWLDGCFIAAHTRAYELRAPPSFDHMTKDGTMMGQATGLLSCVPVERLSVPRCMPKWLKVIFTQQIFIPQSLISGTETDLRG